MFARLEVRIVAISEDNEELSDLHQKLRSAVSEFDVSHQAAIRIADSLERKTDAEICGLAAELGVPLSALGLLPDGSRAQMSFDFAC